MGVVAEAAIEGVRAELAAGDAAPRDSLGDVSDVADEVVAVGEVLKEAAGGGIGQLIRLVGAFGAQAGQPEGARLVGVAGETPLP